ncbi:GGDEF domain-containing protein [uncultured Xylophilus sp.]|uniref:GGDEF domain-containing protein n=1 Tax=uncultured Xylophilus sp. TaxID=296832 RepID=UPI0025D07B5E|nr:GGDEF domain-containing protein [uncultured Xylophilus sp.]
MAERPPFELARETFKLLAARRLLPTPDNYRALYDEIAGQKSPVGFPDAQLRQIAKILPAQLPSQMRLLTQFEAAIAQASWPDLQRTLVGYANLALAGTTTAAADPDAGGAPASAGLPTALGEQVARLVEHLLPALGTEDTRLHEQAQQLLHVLRQPAGDLDALRLMLQNFGFKVSFAAEEQAAIRTALLQALHLVIRNIAELAIDDRWLHGQAEALAAAATPPLTLRRLDDLQARLRDVIFKQSEAKARTVEAQEQVRQMLAAFIARLSSMTEASDVYHDKIERCAEQLGHATTLDQIAPVLQEVIVATRAMSLDSRVHRDELVQMRSRTDAAQAAVGKLQQELDRASAEARHDTLTGALNRKGLDEAVEREIARCRRAGLPLCLALLDIDNFKKINDGLGHDTGDRALVHLAQVARESMRPQDLLGRYGGEEFVVVLPDTLPDDGVQTMQRLQRELTRRFFLKDNEKVLITFSAGVAQVAGDEDGQDTIRRADAAMYLAKRAGKNRVMLG